MVYTVNNKTTKFSINILQLHCGRLHAVLQHMNISEGERVETTLTQRDAEFVTMLLTVFPNVTSIVQPYNNHSSHGNSKFILE